MKKKKEMSGCNLMKERMKNRIMLEKSFSEECAQWMVGRLESLIEHMLCGHAAIAYRKQNGDFQLAKGTLMYYRRTFGRTVAIDRIRGTLVYWDVDAQAWRSFLVENFMEWRPIV